MMFLFFFSINFNSIFGYKLANENVKINSVMPDDSFMSRKYFVMEGVNGNREKR